MKYLILQFDLHQKLFNNVLEGFSDEETNTRLHDDKNMNHVKYLAGHLLNAQYGLAALAGVNANPKWNELFAPIGQSKAKDDFPYPSIEDIKAEWNRLHEPTKAGLGELSEKDMIKKAPIEFFGTVGEMWAFLNDHQSYHIGQIGILRRGFGKEPMSYE